MALIGFRVEIISNMSKRDFKKIISSYNSSNLGPKIVDFKMNSHVAIEKNDGMLITQVCENKKHINTINFSLLLSIKKSKEVKRLVKIINVLGNDRLIKEKIQVFVNGQSMLNNLPEIDKIRDSFAIIEKYIPGLVRNGWYYAPEAEF